MGTKDRSIEGGFFGASAIFAIVRQREPRHSFEPRESRKFCAHVVPSYDTLVAVHTKNKARPSRMFTPVAALQFTSKTISSTSRKHDAAAVGLDIVIYRSRVPKVSYSLMSVRAVLREKCIANISWRGKNGRKRLYDLL